MYGEPDRPVRVAAGIIKKDHSVLLCQRGINHRYGLKWEFPGGKTYPGETISECLLRELEEELHITPVKYSEIKTLLATYADGGIFHITFFLVQDFEGEIDNKVFEKIEWVPIDKLTAYDLLEGSYPILQYLK
jgi:8-oxo-dGTP diphosphatase